VEKWCAGEVEWGTFHTPTLSDFPDSCGKKATLIIYKKKNSSGDHFIKH
jgi:hypothetical protein